MLIEMAGIEKSFQSAHRREPIRVLRGIDLSVHQGELLAIKGSSGAGKSTLLHILGCMDRPTKGMYRLDGQLVSELSSAQLSRVRNTKIGFVLQNFALIEDDNVLSNVGVPLLFGKAHISNIDTLASEQLEKLGLLKLAKQQVATLSGGEKQRVAIARALINQPDIILADEPTGALDKKNSMMVMDIFTELHSQGKTIIIVTHESFVADLCERVVTITDGIVVG